MNPKKHIRLFMASVIAVHVVTASFLKVSEPVTGLVCILIVGYGSIQLIRVHKIAERQVREVKE